MQIAEKAGGRRRIVEHLGSAHTDSELAALLHAARGKIEAGQLQLGLHLASPADATPPVGTPSVITGKRARWLTSAVETAWERLGFDAIDDAACVQSVPARIVEPTSKTDAVRVRGDLGVAAATGGLSLVLFDVTTLHFEAARLPDLPAATLAHLAGRI